MVWRYLEAGILSERVEFAGVGEEMQRATELLPARPLRGSRSVEDREPSAPYMEQRPTLKLRFFDLRPVPADASDAGQRVRVGRTLAGDLGGVRAHGFSSAQLDTRRKGRGIGPNAGSGVHGLRQCE